MIGPPGHVAGVEGGIDNVLEMAVVGAFVGGTRGEEFGQIPVGGQAAGRPTTEGKVHVPGEVEDPAVGGADIEEGVVLRSTAVVVSDPTEDLGGEGAEPLVHVKVAVGGVPEGRSAQAQGVEGIDDGVVVICVLVIVDLPVVAIVFLVAPPPDRAHGNTPHAIGIRALEALHSTGGAGGVVDELILENSAVFTVWKLVFEPFIVKT